MARNTTEQLVVQISADLTSLRASTAEIQRILEQAANRAGSAGQKSGQAFANGFKAALGSLTAYFSLAFFKQLVKEGVQAYADLEMSMKKFNMVFGESAGEVEKWAKTYADAIGVADYKTKAWAANVADMFIGLGGSRKEAAEMSTAIVQMTNDLYLLNKEIIGSREQAFNLMQSGLAGNTRAFKSLGIIINDSVLKSKMMSLGWQGNVADLDAYSKSLLIAAVVQEQYNNLGAEGIAMQDSAARDLEMVKAKWSELSLIIGEAAAPSLLMVAAFVQGILVPAFKVLGAVISWMGEHLYILIPIIAALVTVLAIYVGLQIKAAVVTAIVAVKEAILTAIRWAATASTWALFAATVALVGALTLGIGAAIGLASALAGISAAQKGMSKGAGKMTDFNKMLKGHTPTIRKSGGGGGGGGGGGKPKAIKDQISQEQKLTDKLKEEYDKRVADYSKVTNILLGIQRKFITTKDILIASEQSKKAIKDFNEGISILEKRIGGTELGKKMLDELKTLDPDEYVDYIQALTRAGDKELQQIVSNFGSRHTEAMVTAERAVEAETPKFKKQLEKTGAAAGTAGGTSMGKGLGESFGGVAIPAMEDIMEDLEDIAEIAAPDIGEVAGKGIWDSFKRWLDKIKTALKDVWIGDLTKSVDKYISSKGLVNDDGSVNRDGDPRTPFAAGGIFTGYSRFGNKIFGEAGHEAVIPLSPKGLRPFAEALNRYTNLGGSVIVQNMYVRNDGDIKRIAYELKRLQDADSRNKGYGYGY